jgi:hypothetical protein
MKINLLEIVIPNFSKYLNITQYTFGIGISKDCKFLKLTDYIILRGGFLIWIVLYILKNCNMEF